MSFLQQFRKLILVAVSNALQGFKLWIFKKFCSGHIDGIAICNVSFNAQHSENSFLIQTREALTLIREKDPRRYQRVCRQFDYIVNNELLTGGNFERRGKICNVDYNKYYNTEDPQWNLRMYACLLVHEATHGFLFEKGIPYDKENRQRVEQLCHKEEYRFAQHLESGWAETCIGSFEPDRWKPYWERTQ